MPVKVGVLGSGPVGQSLGSGFIRSGYEVKIGTRDPKKLAQWLRGAGEGASVGSFEDAARFGDLLVLGTKWTGTENAVRLAGKGNFSGKVLIDVTNPLVFDKVGEPPKLGVGFPDSAGQTVQRWLPDAKVVKAFNIITASKMAAPVFEDGGADMIIAGDDGSAKKTVTGILSGWGWGVIDVGGIEQAYIPEAVAMLWIRYGFMTNTWTHAFKLLKK
jgi:8-hydroxy-5-deazaflavin:NADPH oxidoreductase